MRHWLLSGAILLGASAAWAQQQTPYDQPPAWAKEAVWYQIFVERFRNGDAKNDPTIADIRQPNLGVEPPANWSITPWNGNWYQRDPWAISMGNNFGETLQFRRYGGDLKGVIDQLDYLQSMGVNALFLNPINDAPSMHKYDARYYHHVDVNFGPDPEGDKRIIAQEDPNNPATWQWTAADRLFLQLVQKAHARGMKIIMDYSWNHTGTEFWAWKDIVKNQEKSKYKDWYYIDRFDDPATAANEFTYRGWLNVPSLPEVRKVEITTNRKIGHPYEGNVHPEFKAHMFAVTQRWLAPDGVVDNGIDGYRLDVADQVGLGFWRDFRKVVRGVNPNAYLIGEIWWEEWPDKLMNPAPYTKGDVFDAVMFYQVYKPARYFFAENDYAITAEQFKDSLQLQWGRLRPENVQAMMNVSSSHDAPRLLTDFYNRNKYKYHATPSENKDYKTGKPDAATYKRLRLYLAHLFTTLGAPQIWNGEEMGMWGADDPFPRKPLPWTDYKMAPEFRNNFNGDPAQLDPIGFDETHFNWYKQLGQLRRQEPALRSGKLNFLEAKGKKLSYERIADNGDRIVVLFNVSDQPAKFKLGKTATYTDLLQTAGTVSGSTCVVPPMSVRILKQQP